MCRNVSLLPFLHELSENIPRLDLPAHPRVGNGEAAAREVRCLLGFGVKCDRFGEVPLLAIGGGKIRIQIKVIWIELERDRKSTRLNSSHVEISYAVFC